MESSTISTGGVAALRARFQQPQKPTSQTSSATSTSTPTASSIKSRLAAFQSANPPQTSAPSTASITPPTNTLKSLAAAFEKKGSKPSEPQAPATAPSKPINSGFASLRSTFQNADKPQETSSLSSSSAIAPHREWQVGDKFDSEGDTYTISKIDNKCISVVSTQKISSP
ncbi:MAG: hypothetical protein WC860_08285, partial [Candidatus Margulisiibacteriota bacterium]